jgi:hypothetical protein
VAERGGWLTYSLPRNKGKIHAFGSKPDFADMSWNNPEKAAAYRTVEKSTAIWFQVFLIVAV